MRIKEVELNHFKRFTNLKIEDIPSTTKVVVVVGPNGSGKSSLFDGFLHWYRYKFKGSIGNGDYFSKKGSDVSDMSRSIDIKFHDLPNQQRENLKGKFYFRTAYRNDADFTVDNLTRQTDPTDNIRLSQFIQNDAIVKENYERLVSLTLKGVYEESNNNKTVEALRDELIGKIKASLQNVFDDLTLSNIGDPLRNGSFYFEKGISKDFHYKNLSGGEKSAFDILLDLIIKSSYYENSVYCIDEPEAHMHTRLQSRLFEEIYRLIPGQSQLWLNTHSLGMLKKARDIEKANPNTIAFINFDGIDFDKPTVLKPTGVDKTIWERFVEISLDDYSNLLSPSKVVFCEGNQAGRKYKAFDSMVFSKIFGNLHPDTSFISLGSSSELEKDDNTTFTVINQVLKGSQIIKVVDRDDKSPAEISEANKKGIKVLKKRHIESYLLEDEIIEKLCNTTGNATKIPDALQIKKDKIAASVARGNPSDDVKSASGDIYVELKKLLGLTGCGNTKDAFLRDTICPLITPDTTVYKELEIEILK